ncbi:hypothetical protein SAMN04487781_1860 [Cellulosimicrobium cellulans]|nr:hypothetical protein SAMN04487781_1860 [Cellulosimicrobium cellulans]
MAGRAARAGRGTTTKSATEEADMSENDERGYDPAEDPDADPRSLNPREGRQASGSGSEDTDPDAEPGNVNPRTGGEASGDA